MPQPSLAETDAFALDRIATERIGTNREENFSAKRAPSLKATWLPPAYVHQSWPPRCSEPPPPRTHQTIGLIVPLRSRASFASLSKNGRRRQGRWCWVRYAPDESSTTETGSVQKHALQVGFAIGRSVGNAVVRNRIRRRLRPIVVAEAPNLPPGLYLIGVKNDRAATASYEDLQNDLQTTLRAACVAPSRQ